MNNTPLHLLHLAAGEADEKVWIPEFKRMLEEIGSLEIRENVGECSEEDLTSMIRQADVLLTSWGSAAVPEAIAEDSGKLRYICHVNGGVRHVPRSVVAAGIPVTNWGDAPAQRLAEAAFTLLLSVLKDIPGRVDTVREGGWKPPSDVYGGTLEGLDIGIYGLGVIGRAFEKMLWPFGATVRVYDPYQKELPESCERVESLRELFARSRAIIIHAGLSEETAGSVTAELLSLLPDHSVIINTARGRIVDQEALFAEIGNGRLRAGLDVLDPEALPVDHPARRWKNLILTAHDLGKIRPLPGQPPGLWKFHHVCCANLKRFVEGLPLEHLVDLKRYDIST